MNENKVAVSLVLGGFGLVYVVAENRDQVVEWWHHALEAGWLTLTIPVLMGSGGEKRMTVAPKAIILVGVELPIDSVIQAPPSIPASAGFDVPDGYITAGVPEDV